MSSYMHIRARHLIPAVFNSLFFKKLPNQSTLLGTIVTAVSSGYACATVVAMIVHETLDANSALL